MSLKATQKAPTVTLKLKVPPSVRDGLKKIASSEDRTMSKVAIRALVSFIKQNSETSL